MSFNPLRITGNNEIVLPAFNDLALAKMERKYCSSTIYVNPLRASNKILVNKEKLSKGARSKAALSQTPSERIHYNPKFLCNANSSAADTSIKPSSEFIKCQVGVKKTADSNIHINRNYLTTVNNTNVTFRNLCDNSQTQCRELSRIHINPRFLRNQNQLESSPASSTPCDNASTELSSLKRYSPVKRKELIKSSVTLPAKNNNASAVVKSKYKFINNSINQSKIVNNFTPICYKSKYSLKRLSIRKDSSKISNKINEASKITNIKNKFEKLSSEFKTLSRTKLVRKSMLQSKILARRCSRNNLYKRSCDLSLYKKIPLRRKTRNIIYFPKRNNQQSKQKSTTINNNSFKRLSQMKIIRKSLLKAQIEARNQVRKHYYLEYRNFKSRRKNFIGSLRRKYVAKHQDVLKWRNKRQTCELTQAKGKRSRQTLASKTFKKNNHPCPFYNRFGRCKGKDKGTCPKLHDAQYISICRKLLQGECNGKDCLLSHDIQPGKMPTCHHYLAGLCTRPNCPYLHIKVNPKAPICMAFLQGFCPDVFNCLKRHEFICPIYAEKGICPKGKSCTYPHRSSVVRSKLLKDDQKPLIHRTDVSIDPMNESKLTNQEVSNTVKTSLECNSENSEDKNSINIKNKKQCKKEYVKESFTRYFAIQNKEDQHDDKLILKEENEMSENNRNEFT